MNSLSSLGNAKEFLDLIQIIRQKEEVYSDKLEEYYEKLLNFLINNNRKQYFSQWMIEQIKAMRHGREERGPLISVDAIAYCMHELRWSDVLKEAQAEHEDYYCLRMDSTLLPIIDAFSDGWSDAEVYARFSKG